MSEKRFLYFLLGVLSVVGIGAGLGLSGTGIIFPDGTVQTTAAAGRRSFYLTDTAHDGAEALVACVSGFHMASMWEIWDLSNLRYATEQANVYTTDDSGQGPPNAFGWVRTGYLSSSSASGGQGNCSTWSSVSGFGTMVAPVLNWASTSVSRLGPWDTLTSGCGVAQHVWCVEDLN